MIHRWYRCLPPSLKQQDPNLAQWLGLQASLTQHLRQASPDFRVTRLRQGHAMPHDDEYAALHLPRPRQVQQREVLLLCHQQAAVFAHTIVLQQGLKAAWPFFDQLGQRSLGSMLFADPQVKRGALYFSCLSASHPLWRKAQQSLIGNGQTLPLRLWARRSLFQRQRGVMLVTEVFLPGLPDFV